MRTRMSIMKPGMAGSGVAAVRADASPMRRFASRAMDAYDSLIGMEKLDKEELRKRKEQDLRLKTGKEQPMKEGEKIRTKEMERTGETAKKRFLSRLLESPAVAPALAFALAFADRLVNKMLNLEVGAIEARLKSLKESRAMSMIATATDLGTMWLAGFWMASGGYALSQAIGGGLASDVIAYPAVAAAPFALNCALRPALKAFGHKLKKQAIGPNLPTFLASTEISDIAGLGGLVLVTSVAADALTAGGTLTASDAMVSVAMGTAVGTVAMWGIFGFVWKLAVRRDREEKEGLLRGAAQFAKGFADGFKSVWLGKRVAKESLDSTYREAGFYAGTMESLYIAMQAARMPIVAMLASSGEITPDNIIGPMFIATAKWLGPVPGMLGAIQLKKLDGYL